MDTEHCQKDNRDFDGLHRFISRREGGVAGWPRVTTFYGALDALADEAPLTKVVWDKKYIDSGKVITAAGLSSGIDGSLYAV
jgi:transcriptional regulator GlxA family with amidase domain